MSALMSELRPLAAVQVRNIRHVAPFCLRFGARGHGLLQLHYPNIPQCLRSNFFIPRGSFEVHAFWKRLFRLVCTCCVKFIIA